MATHQPITVLGCGVVGMTCATVLADAGYSNITIVARDLALDANSTSFSSPWAGANLHPFTPDDPRQARWEKHTFDKLMQLESIGLVMKTKGIDYCKERPVESYMKQFKNAVITDNIPQSIKETAKLAMEYENATLDVPKYLEWMYKNLQDKKVKIIRSYCTSLAAALKCSKDNESQIRPIIINATGLGARSLEDSPDLDVVPIRGQTVLVRAPKVKTNSQNFNTEDVTYVIPRPSGDVICGGCFETGSWDTSINFAQSERILRDAVAMEPQLSPTGKYEDLEVLRHNVGLRPSRTSGPRLEHEKRKEFDVIHCYGIGPAGFQASWGMAADVRQIVLSLSPDRQAKL